MASTASADCGRVTIADMNWASAELAAYVDKFILEKGYGCKVELVLNFRMKRGLASAIIGPAFTRIANGMVDSFCARAQELHERQDSH